jgi:tetratricopeptide (TPR) repeat protein
MKAQTLRTLVEIHQNKLIVETSLNPAKKQIQSTVQLNNQPLYQRDLNISQDQPDEAFVTDHLFPEAHKGFIAELESIFRIKDKVDENPTVDKCFMVGFILMGRGFYGEALKQFQKVLELNPRHIQAVKHYGIVLTLQGDYENAKHVLTSAAESAPGYADVLYYLGNVYLFQRRFEEARQSYLRALEINPSYAEARLKLATCSIGILASQNNLVDAMVQELVEDAQREAQLALQLNPKIGKSAHLTGLQNLREGKYPMAFKCFLDSRPKFIPKTGSEEIYFYTLKLLYSERGVSSQETEAYITQLEQLIEENPTYADIRLHYSIAHLIKSNFIVSRSLKEMKKAIETNPGFQKALTSVDVLSEIYKKMMQAVKSIYSGD